MKCRAWIVLAAGSLASCGAGSSSGSSPAADFVSPALTSVEGDRGAEAADGHSPIELVVQVIDVKGKPSAGVLVEFRASGHHHVIVQPAEPTGADGIARGSIASHSAETKTVGVVLQKGGSLVELPTMLDLVFAPAPRLQGVATYLDSNTNGRCDAGDEIVVPFDQDVTAHAASLSDFELVVQGDRLGGGGHVASGPATDEITLVLGALPRLRTRHAFPGSAGAAGGPSGIDVRAGRSSGSVVDALGITVAPSQPIDLWPGFVRSDVLLGGDNGRSIAAGDVDGDGDADLVVGNYDRPSRVYINPGDGRYMDSGQQLGSDPTLRVALGDVDRDGDLDLVVANDRRENRLYWNDGSGSFSQSGLDFGNAFARDQALLLADLNGDGLLDAVCGTEINRANPVFLGAGAHGFSAAGSLGAWDTRAIAAGDVDADGDVDLLLGNASNQPNRIYFNDGAGGFVASSQSLGGASTVAVALADLDADADLDLIFGNEDPGFGNQVCWNDDGRGTIRDSGQRLGSGTCMDVELLDVDADGDVDLLVGNSDRPAEVHLNDGAGFFGASAQDLGSGGVRDLVLADADGDGDADLMTVRPGAAPTEILLASLSGTYGDADFFSPALAVDTPDAACAGLADVDGDGDLDLLVGRSAGGIAVQRADGGSFDVVDPIVGSGSIAALVGADFDQDGRADLAAARNGADTQVYRGNGDGTFTPSGVPLATGTQTRHLLAADLDDDGDLDLVASAGGASSQPNRIFWNDGAGGFADAGQFLGAQASGAAVAADFDRDGDLDLAFAAGSAAAGNGDRLYWNQGGTLVDSGQSLGNEHTTELHCGDFDRDGDPDLLAIHANAPARLYFNNAGNFVDGPSIGSGGSGPCAAVADFDGDGDLDVVLAHAGPDQLFANDGSGTFQLTQVGLAFGSSRAILAADFDADGDRDLLFVRPVPSSELAVRQ